jgi:transposase
MMGFQGTPARLFYDFRLEEHVPVDHMLRGIDRHLALDDLRQSPKPFYSQMGRPSVDPELMIRMLIVDYCMGIRSERRLCDEVHLNLAYRWFCRLGLDGRVPDHSTFSKNRHGSFRESDGLHRLFESVVQRCIAEGLVSADGIAIDASLIAADANKQRSVPSRKWKPDEIKEAATRAAVKQKTTTPHIPVFDKSNRTDGTFSRADFVFNPERDRYTCPAGKELVQFRRTYAIPRSGVTAEGTRLYRASKLDCDVRKLKAQCCPNALARRIPRDLHEDARDVARAHAATPQYVEACRGRKKVEMLFAHLKRILRLARLRLRGPNGPRDEFLLAATAQNLRRLARLRPTACFRKCWPPNADPSPPQAASKKQKRHRPRDL